MINAQFLQQYFRADYRGADSILSEVLEPIFGRAERNNQSIIVNNSDQQKAQSANIKDIRNIATLNPEGSDESIKVFDVTIEDNCHIHIARKGIQHLVREWVDRFEGAFIVFHYANPQGRSWRLSYLEKRSKNTDSTSAKRYTYLCGQDYPCRTIAERFSKLSPDNINSSILEDTFSAEALSTEFFTEYKNFYDDFVSYVIQDKKMFPLFLHYAENDEELAKKSVRDYIKKLMGRLVFIQFLQKKAWLNNDLHYMLSLFNTSTDKQKEDYLDNVLEPLFFGIFNTKKEDRPQLFKDNKWDKALLDKWADFPYLNGGLFECDELDKLRLPIPSYFFSNPENKDVIRKPTDKYYEDACGIFDFFERYNFTIDESDPLDKEVGVDPEMLGKIFENLLEDNKDKGAFYTPKEIVQYMCREALIAYLVGEVKKKSEGNEPTQVNFEEDIRQFVTDPEMTVAQIAQYSDTQLLDLAESLEQVKICDPAIGSGAFPMGLLNLLVECREALNKALNINLPRYILKKDIILNNIYGVDIERGAIDIARLRFWLSIVVDLEKPEALPNFDYKFMQGNSLLEQYKGFDLSNLTKSKMTKVGNALLSIFDDNTDVFRRQLSEYMKSYYACSDHVEKADLYNKIRTNVENQIAEGGMSVNMGGIDICANDQFFLWHTWFKDVFDQGGFDIVIGNPPYISSKDIDAQLKLLYKKNYITAVAQFDMYSLFIELACSYLKKGGVTSFIVPDSLIGRSNFTESRKLLIKDRQVVKWVHINNVFESANVSSLIYVVNNINTDKYSFDYVKAEDVFQWISRKYMVQTMLTSEILQDPECKVIFGNAHETNLLSKLLNYECQFLKAFIMWRGEELGRSSELIETIKNNNLQLLAGDNVTRYGVISCTRWIAKTNVIKDLNLYQRPKILIRQLGDKINATIDYTGSVTLQSVYCLVLRNLNDKELPFYLGVLNSRLFNFIYAKISGDKQTFKRIILENIKRLPLEDNVQPEIISLVNQILAAKKSNPNADTSALESQIDELVYDLYGLSEDEKQIVRNA